MSDECECYKLNKESFNHMVLGSLSDIMMKTISRRASQNKVAISCAKVGDTSTTKRDIEKEDLSDISFLGSGTFGKGERSTYD